MKYSEAFQTLGYHLAVPRQDWTAINDSGICISLWREGVRNFEGKLSYDTGNRSRDEAAWMAKAGHKKRTKHLREALERYNGFVDVVIVDGVTGESVDDADPWVVSKRKNHKWRIIDFDPSTGHFKVETQQLDAQTS